MIILHVQLNSLKVGSFSANRKYIKITFVIQMCSWLIKSKDVCSSLPKTVTATLTLSACLPSHFDGFRVLRLSGDGFRSCFSSSCCFS